MAVKNTTNSSYPASRGDNTPIEHLSERDRLVPRMASWDSIFRQSFWYAGFNPDLLTTQQGYDKYDEMLTMAACRSPLNVLLYGILRKGWKVEAAVTDPMDARHEEAQVYATALQWALSNIVDDADNVQDFRQALYRIGMAVWYGFSLADIIYRVCETDPLAGKLGYQQFADKPQKMIGWDLDKDTLAVRNIIPYTPATGYGPPRPVEGCVRYTYAPTNNLPHGNGMGRFSYKHWFMLNKTLQFWAIAAERFGGPVPVAYYPAGGAGAMATVQAALDAYRAGANLVLPDNAKLELTANPQGTLEQFKVKADWHVQQIAQGILGNTLTTGEGRRSGSLALGGVHQDTQDDIEGYIRKDIEEVATLQIARRFIRYNFGDSALALLPRISLGDYDDEDRKVKADMYCELIDKGVTHKRAKYIRTDLGLPPLDADEEKLLDEEDKAEKEMQERQADARQSAIRPRKATMSDADREERMARLAEAWMAGPPEGLAV